MVYRTIYWLKLPTVEYDLQLMLLKFSLLDFPTEYFMYCIIIENWLLLFEDNAMDGARYDDITFSDRHVVFRRVAVSSLVCCCFTVYVAIKQQPFE